MLKHYWGCLSDDEANGEVFNIAFGESSTIQELFDTLAKLLGKKNIKPVYGPIRNGDIPHSLADISKARKLLGYTPEYDFKQGLSLAADWYIKRFSQEVVIETNIDSQ